MKPKLFPSFIPSSTPTSECQSYANGLSVYPRGEQSTLWPFPKEPAFCWPQVEEALPDSNTMGKVHDRSLFKSDMATVLMSANFGNSSHDGQVPQGICIGREVKHEEQEMMESRQENPSTPKARSKPSKKPTTSTKELKHVRSSLKERQRNQNLNDAFMKLQKCVPYVPEDQRLVKIKTLRLAAHYIEHLKKVLEGRDMGDFATEVMSEMQRRNAYKQRAEEEIALSKQFDTSRSNSTSLSTSPTTSYSNPYGFGHTIVPQTLLTPYFPPVTYTMPMNFDQNKNMGFPTISASRVENNHTLSHSY